MSSKKTAVPNSKTRADLRRRKFISTGILGGLTLALTPGLDGSVVRAADNATPDTLPTPADSLSLYLLLLDRMKSSILNPYFDLLNCLSADVTSRYAQLQKDVAELERLVPALRARPETTNLRSVSGIGYASASLMETLATQRIMLTNASFTLASMDPELLRNTASELQRQRGSLTLSPSATALLRRILAEIHDLGKPSEGLGKTTEIIMELNNDLDGAGGKMTAIRKKLVSAISLLIAAELNSGTDSAAAQTAAAADVQGAIDQLEKLDVYVPPKSLTAYVSNSRLNRCPEARARTTVAAFPTQSVRELLAGTKKWIESGGQMSASAREEVQDEVRYVKASVRTPMNPFLGRWYQVRKALYDNLPPATNGRTFVCLGLIAPILIGYQGQQRINLIAQQLFNLMPSGTSDQLPEARKRAAETLANL